MTFSIDLDHTWTADPSLWQEFVNLCVLRGHKVIVVTNRDRWSDDIPRFSIPPFVPIVFAGARLKADVATEAGYAVDVWIDDRPGTIQRCLIL
jgi:hypothetical protein